VGKLNLPRYLDFAGTPAKSRYRPGKGLNHTIYGEKIENDKAKMHRKFGG
jgi:hypothetical protein